MVSRRWAAGAALAVMFVAGCTGSPTPVAATATTTPTSAVSAGTTDTMALGDRPFKLHVPPGYHTGTAAPLVILLHGYTSSGDQQEGYMKFTPESDKRGFLYATPDGTVDAQHNRFWNATKACCNFYGSQVDDVAYIADIIKTVSAKYTVDAKKVYLIGHSNGAFMAYRMACDRADLIAGIAALNGAMPDDVSTCQPKRPVSVLTIRGTADDVIVYTGSQIAGNPYPSTETTVGDWITLDGCQTTPETSAPLIDLDSGVSGPDTSINRYPGCQGNAHVELWNMRDSIHVPGLTPNFVPSVMDFLLAQSL